MGLHEPLARLRTTALVAFALVLVACSATPTASTPIATGQKYVMATHSFSVFIGPTRPRDSSTPTTPGPLAALAAERGKVGHEALAVQMIGGSTPMQHWNQGNGDDTNNLAKVALKKGGVDVFTMSPNVTIPEPGIDLFGDFVIKTNPKARILVQNSWSSWDGTGTTPAVGGTGNKDFQAIDHDKATPADLNRWLAALEEKGGYLPRLRAQLEGIDKRAGREITYIVPSANAVYTFRKEIIARHIPGIEKQSDIFRDGIGHPKQPLANLVTYVWYATMYRENPVGLQAFVDKSDPTSAPREKLLQEIAWNAVVAEPKSGVTGKAIRL